MLVDPQDGRRSPQKSIDSGVDALHTAGPGSIMIGKLDRNVCRVARGMYACWYACVFMCVRARARAQGRLDPLSEMQILYLRRDAVRKRRAGV